MHICKNSTIQSQKLIRSGKIVCDPFQKQRKSTVKLKSNLEYDYVLRITINLFLIVHFLSNLPQSKILRIIFLT